jgi:hypothetical protein
MKYSTLLVVMFVATPVFAQTPADSAAIRATALDYIEGFYEGNGERMERALHPSLAKRIVVVGGSESIVRNMTAAQLIDITRKGGGSATPESARRKDLQITGIYGNAATVTIDATGWVDFLHVGKVDGQWVIINVLWEMRPES